MCNNGKINSILENLKKQNQQDYGVAVFDVDLQMTKNGIVFAGEVLTENQKNQIMEFTKKEKIKVFSEKIKVLSDVSKRYEIGWAIAKNEVVDLKLRFVSNKILNEKILKRIRCSQVFKGEILRVLFKNEDQFLVQQNDLTLGWINRNDIIVKKKSLLKEWKRGSYAIKGEVIKITNNKNKKINCHSELDSESVVDFKKDILVQKKQKILWQNQGNIIIKEAEKYLGTKYLLGGKTEKGIDCSGLVQCAYKNSLNVILPKHSWDQKEMGKKVKLEDVKTGDLVFLIKKGDKHKHVGIAEVISESLTETLTGRNINLIHASLDQKKVVRQNLRKVFENYDFVEVRRIVV